MIEKAVEGIDYFVPCDYEIRRKGVSYTSDTLTGLRDLYPDRELYLIMGADSLMNIESWHCPEIILNQRIYSLLQGMRRISGCWKLRPTDWHSFTARRFMC